MSFEGKTFLVTGASRGIGRCVAVALGRRGATVAVHYGRSQEAAERVLGEIVAGGGRGFSVQGDLSSPDAPAAIIEDVGNGLTRLGVEPHLDGLVLSAGELILGDLEHLTPSEFDRAMAVNVRAPLFLVQASLALLADGARIVTVSAAITRWSDPVLLAQAGAKAALQNVSRTLAATLGPRGIGVVDVAPGVVRTDLAGPWLADAAYAQQVADSTALRRPGEPDDVADAIVALLSPDARWITGETIAVSGGYRL